jgi:hemolysin activation/secretion protein
MLRTAFCRTWTLSGFIGLWVSVGFVPTTFAQLAPDAGGILRQIDPAIAAPIKPPPSILLPRESRPALPTQSEFSIEVRGFNITSATAFSETQLLLLVQDAIGSTLNIQELDSIADRITRFYRDHGYLVARAYVPAQEVKNGSVEIAVLEGFYSAINVQNKSLLDSQHFAHYLAPLQQSRAIEQQTLERSLLLLSDAAGIGAITPTLSPGNQVGGSELAVKLDAAPRFSASLDGDNYGGKSNAENRLGFVVNMNSPTGRGDQLTLRGIFTPPGFQPSEGPHGRTLFGRLTYVSPLGHRGLRAGVAFSDLRYRIGEPFQALDASGDAKISSAFLSYPFVRGRDVNLYGQLAYDNKRIVDSSLANQVQFGNADVARRINVVTLAITGDRRDDLLDGALNRYSAAFTLGDVKIQTVAARNVDEDGLATHGSFSKVYLNFERLQRISETWSLSFSAALQESNSNLDAAEKFSLSGPNGVRAYGQGYLAGDCAYLATLELRKTFEKAPWFQFLVFVDHGAARIDRNPLASSSDNRRTLSGTGIGLMAALANNFAVRLNHAWRFNADEPARREPVHQTWFQVVKYF